MQQLAHHTVTGCNVRPGGIQADNREREIFFDRLEWNPEQSQVKLQIIWFDVRAELEGNQNLRAKHPQPSSLPEPVASNEVFN